MIMTCHVKQVYSTPSEDCETIAKFNALEHPNSYFIELKTVKHWNTTKRAQNKVLIKLEMQWSFNETQIIANQIRFSSNHLNSIKSINQKQNDYDKDKKKKLARKRPFE